MVYKKGSKGDEVKKIQKALNINADGDFGPKTEEAVKKFQKEHGLTDDGVVGEKTWNTLFPDEKAIGGTKDDFIDMYLIVPTYKLVITKGYIDKHITKSPNRPIKYIAVHYTAGGSSKKGTAMNTRNVFLKRNASADFVVDDETVVQINPDLKNYYCWSVGDKKNPYSKGGRLYGKATNKNTVSIEMCSTLMNGWGASAANHDGWYISDKVVDNTVRLVKYLMKTYNVPKENVVRHYDISGKLCPGVIGWNTEPVYDNKGKKTNRNSDESDWDKFKSSI